MYLGVKQFATISCVYFIASFGLVFVGNVHWVQWDDLAQASDLSAIDATIREYIEVNGVPPLAVEAAWDLQSSGRPLPSDSWGRPFHYQAQAQSYVLAALGADGTAGGSGEDRDVVAGELPRTFTVDNVTELMGSMFGLFFLVSALAGAAAGTFLAFSLGQFFDWYSVWWRCFQFCSGLVSALLVATIAMAILTRRGFFAMGVIGDSFRL